MVEINWLDIEEKAKSNLHELVFSSELKFQGQVDMVAEDIFSKKDVKVIMVAGPSSSGKTTFSNRLTEKLQEKGIMSHYIGLDDFYLPRVEIPKLESGLYDFDSPRALNLKAINKTIKNALNNGVVEIPKYDFLTGNPSSEKTIVSIQSNDLVIIEGIHALNPMFTLEYDDSRFYKIAIHPQKTFIMPSGTRLVPEDLRLLRRTIRDLNTRGSSLLETATQWDEVCIGERKYITPYLDTANFSIDSAFEYELFLYKRCINKALDKCDIDRYAKIKQALSEVSLLPNIDIPAGSLLNEFAIK